MAVDEVLKTLNRRSDRIIPAARQAAALKRLDEEAIRARAHEIYVQRVATGKLGDAESDWLEAESELMSDAVAPQAPLKRARV
jgi:hypothetical protein